jgi:hypothetical protein
MGLKKFEFQIVVPAIQKILKDGASESGLILFCSALALITNGDLEIAISAIARALLHEYEA